MPEAWGRARGAPAFFHRFEIWMAYEKVACALTGWPRFKGRRTNYS